MKTLNQFLFALLSIMLIISCSKEEFDNQPFAEGSQSLVATIYKRAQTRVGFDGTDGAFFWTKGDKIGVTTESSVGGFQEMTLQGEGGESSGTFTGTLGGSVGGYAVYPYNSSHSINNNELTYNLPTTYTYTTLDATYANPTGNSHNAPMWAQIENNAASFKHLAGVVAISVGDLPANTQNLVLKFTAEDEKITGNFTANLTESNPTISTSDITEGDNIVTINFNTALAQTQGHFYIPVPVGDYGKFSMQIEEAGIPSITKEWTNVKVERCAIIRAIVGTITSTNSNGKEVISSVSSVEDVTDAINSNAESNIVVVTDEISGNPIISLPKLTNAEDKSVSIVLNNVNSSKVTFNEVDGTGTTAQDIQLSVPSVSEIDIDLPNSTVKLSGGTYGTVNALTAENTLIISKGVSVGTLTITKGNVRIEGGKVTESISNSSNKEVVYVISDTKDLNTYQSLGQTIKNSITKIECSLDDYVEVNSAAELYAASKGVKNITLGANIEVNANTPVEPRDGQTYDLNEKTLSIATIDNLYDVLRVKESGAEVTIKNGTIDNQTGNNFALSIRADNVTLNMEDVIIPVNDYDGSLHKNGNYTGCTVNLTDCNFIGAVYLSNTDDKSPNTITVTGGEYTSNNYSCFEFLNTNATIDGAKLSNTVAGQSYAATGNEGNNFSVVKGYCIAFTNTDGVKSKGTATLTNNTYSIADEDGKHIFNQLKGATITGSESIFTGNN